MRNRLLPRLLCAASLSFSLALLIGCGGAKPVKVSGKIILPAKLKVAESDTISVLLVPEDASNKNSTSLAGNPQDLTFTGVALPGKYKVGVAMAPYAGMKDSEAREKLFEQKLGQFNTGATSLRYEVTTDASQTFTIDLEKSAITKP